MDDLSTRQAEILDFIKMHVDQHGVVPSYREIGAAVGIGSTNGVSDHIKALVRKGYVERGARGSPRNLTLTPKASGLRDEETTLGVPVLGRIAAGLPLLAEENYEGTIRVDATLLPGSGSLFALLVNGESMIEDGIHDGDYLFVRQRKEFRNGQIVVVLVDGEATVKRVWREKSRLKLVPSNSSMSPFYADATSGEVDVLGVAVGVYRRIH